MQSESGSTHIEYGVEMIEDKKVTSKLGCLMFSAWNAYDYLITWNFSDTLI